MKTARFSALLAILLSLAACGNLRVKAYQTYQAGADVNSVALTAFYLAPLSLPEVPAADAKTFNEKVFALSKGLNKRLAENSTSYYNTLASGLELQLDVNTLAGESLAQQARFDRLKSKEDLEGLKISGQPKFPEMFIGEGGLNIFELENGDLKGYIEGNPRMRSALRGAAKSLETEVIAFAYARPVIDRVTTYGAKANFRLLVDVYLYNEKGELAGHAFGETVPVTITGDSMAEYDQVFDSYTALQSEILTALTLVEEEEVDEE